MISEVFVTDQRVEYEQGGVIVLNIGSWDAIYSAVDSKSKLLKEVSGLGPKVDITWLILPNFKAV